MSRFIKVKWRSVVRVIIVRKTIARRGNPDTKIVQKSKELDRYANRRVYFEQSKCALSSTMYRENTFKFVSIFAKQNGLSGRIFKSLTPKVNLGCGTA